MLYAIISEDVEDSRAARIENRPAHLERLQKLNNENRLVIAGPHPKEGCDSTDMRFSGSLIVAEFDSLEHAKDWAAADPYVSGGVCEKVVVKPFKKVLP